MIHIVKRRGHKEEYDERKVYASAYAACLNVHLGEIEAEEIATKISNEVKMWISEKKEVTSRELFERIKEELAKHNKDASFMYETHLDVSGYLNSKFIDH